MNTSIFSLLVAGSALAAGCDPCQKPVGTQYFIGPSGGLEVSAATGTAAATGTKLAINPNADSASGWPSEYLIVPLDDAGHIEEHGLITLGVETADITWDYSFDDTPLTAALAAFNIDLRADSALAPLIGSSFSLQPASAFAGTCLVTAIAGHDTGEVALELAFSIFDAADASTPVTTASVTGVQPIAHSSETIFENECD